MKKFLISVLGLAIVAGATAGAAPASARVVVKPLRANAPAWFTPSLADRAVRAGERGVPLPRQANVPMSSLAFVGIRPGQQIIVTNTDDLLDAEYFSLCTANFVFQSGTKSTGKGKRAARGPGGSGSYAIGTAGHCGGVGEKVFMIFAPLGLVYIGDIIKSTYSENRLAPDFALIQILPALNQWVSPSMAHWGGPTGAYTDEQPIPMVHSGHGLVVGTGGTPRAGVAYGWFGQEYRFAGVINMGDSGSGANTATGLALGNITHIAIDTSQGVPVWFGGTSIEAILGLTGGWDLATCRLPIPWPLPGCPPL